MFLVITIITFAVFLTSVIALYRIRTFAMNETNRRRTTALFKGSVVILIGAVVELAAWLGNSSRFAIVASVVTLTGVSIYFNTLRAFVKNHTISYDKADLVELIIWAFWAGALINMLLHIFIVWIY